MTRRRLARAARSLSVLASGVFAGFLITVLVLELTARSVPAALYIELRRIELVHFDDLATALLLPALLATVVGVALGGRNRGRTFWRPAAAAVLLVVVVVITVAVNLPINTIQEAWRAEAPPSDWMEVRDHWQLAHALRTAVAVCAFALLADAGDERSSNAASGDRDARLVST